MQNNQSVQLANIRMLEFVATKLEEMCDDFVFIGGCTTGLLITDPLFPDVRYTLDVDCIVDVISLRQYHQLESKLTKKGFKKSLTEEVICRWFYDDIILDVMPTDENILGFGNRWYKQAIAAAVIYNLTPNISIKVVTAPHFLATKLEAFKSRGKSDYYASHDFEDIMSILDGRVEIVEEIHQAVPDLRNYLIQAFIEMDSSSAFKGAIPGHFVQYGNYANDRITMVERRIKEIIGK
ncbi:MAG: hypothetical protein WC748_05530 [Legionellales bacterium]|jgi:hypothetical protein